MQSQEAIALAKMAESVNQRLCQFISNVTARVGNDCYYVTDAELLVWAVEYVAQHGRNSE